MTTSTHGYTANKDALLKRLNRIEGRVPVNRLFKCCLFRRDLSSCGPNVMIRANPDEPEKRCKYGIIIAKRRLGRFGHELSVPPVGHVDGPAEPGWPTAAQAVLCTSASREGGRASAASHLARDSQIVGQVLVREIDAHEVAGSSPVAPASQSACK